MNDARRCQMIDDVRAACKALGITIRLTGETIALMRKSAAANRDYAMFYSLNTIEETWAFLSGYCAANGADIHDLLQKAEE